MPRISAPLDKFKVSDRDAVHLLTAFVDSLFLNSAEFIMNRTSIKNSRQHLPEHSAGKVRAYFLNLKVNFVVIHWDGKFLPNLIGIDSSSFNSACFRTASWCPTISVWYKC